MSLILDALNRAREDTNPIPGLTTHHPVEQVSVNRRQYLLWVALSVAIVVIAWLFMERYSAPQPLVQETVVSESGSPANSGRSVSGGVDGVGRSDSAAERAPAPNIESVAPVAETVMPEVVDQEPALVATKPSALEDAPQTPAATLPDGMAAHGESPAEVRPDNNEENASPPNDAVAELYRNPPVSAEPVARKPQGNPAAREGSGPDENLDIDQLVRLAREEARNVGLPESSVPLLIDLSQQIKDSIPTVYYLRHDYSSDASRSTVVLNSKTLSVGGSPAAGMKVEEILPDSVVLNYQGTQFRLRALNSWINL